eukprot:3788974-Amphidinium_carterae.1
MQSHTSFRFTTYNALTLSDSTGLRAVGQITHIIKLLDEDQVDACTIQEARLTLPDEFTTASFYIHNSPPIKGHGGLLTLVRKAPHVAVLQTHIIYHRLQKTTVKFHNRTLHILNGHAPTKISPKSAHETFQQHVRSACDGLAPHHLFLGGFDLNARMGTAWRFHPNIGPLVTDVCYPTHVANLLEFFHEQSLYLVNTIVAPHNPDGSPITASHPDLHDAVSTWRHQNLDLECSHQIDYVVANQAAFDLVTTCQPAQWARYCSLHDSDHRAVSLQMVVCHGTPAVRHRPQAVHRTFVSEAHKAKFDSLFAKVMLEYHDTHPVDTTPAVLQLEQIQQLAMMCLQQSAPKRSLVPKKPW